MRELEKSVLRFISFFYEAVGIFYVFRCVCCVFNIHLLLCHHGCTVSSIYGFYVNVWKITSGLWLLVVNRVLPSHSSVLVLCFVIEIIPLDCFS